MHISQSESEKFFSSGFDFAVEQCAYGGQEYIQIAFEVVFGEGSILTKWRVDVLQPFGRHMPSDIDFYLPFEQDRMQQIQKAVADVFADYLGQREGFEFCLFLLG